MIRKQNGFLLYKLIKFVHYHIKYFERRVRDKRGNLGNLKGKKTATAPFLVKRGTRILRQKYNFCTGVKTQEEL